MRNLPLHKDGLNAKRSADSHAGLWYDRFFDKYIDNYKKPQSNPEKAQYSEGKTDWIKSNATQVGNEGLLRSFIDRQCKLINAEGGILLVMSSDWHFVTGMGNNHPVENGFAWHPTLGVPYLTGAAVKGVLRTWCEVWTDGDIDLKQWFGDTEQSGELIIFDAVPTRPVQLKADIMTPHYGDWYAKGDQIKDVNAEADKVPADWHDPIPVSFLVVDKGASFQFGIAKVCGSMIDLGNVSQELSDALQWIGAGAKTAVGYGRFTESREDLVRREKEMYAKERQSKILVKHAEQEAKREKMTPVEAELDLWLESKPEPSTVAAWLERTQEMTLNDKKLVAVVLKSFYEQRGTWAKPSKKQKPNVQKIKTILRSQS